MLLKWKWIPAAVSEVCFSAGAGHLSWEEACCRAQGKLSFVVLTRFVHTQKPLFLQDFPNTKPANKPQCVHG